MKFYPGGAVSKAQVIKAKKPIMLDMPLAKATSLRSNYLRPILQSTNIRNII
jgi:hypothetical protein